MSTQPTPEELEAIRLYLEQMQSDPLARATNDYGQGAGFLQLKDTPTSWDRAGDKVDLLTDFLKGTKTYLPDWIPDLNPEAEDPGIFTGYRSDVADLYRNNPAYNEIDLAMSQDGASFEEALQAVAASPEFAVNLPKTERGGVDLSAFRNSAETYVSERAREGREYDVWDAERQAYEDYVNPRSQWSDMGNDQLDPAALMRRTDYKDPMFGAGSKIAEGFQNVAARAMDTPVGRGEMPLQQPERMRRVSPGSPSTWFDGIDPAAALDRNIGDPIENFVSSLRFGKGQIGEGEEGAKIPYPRIGRQQQATGTFVAPRERQAPKRVEKPKPKARTAAQRNEGNRAYNKSAQAVYDFQKKKQSANAMPSKKQENLAKLAAYYNAYVYGE